MISLMKLLTSIEEAPIAKRPRGNLGGKFKVPYVEAICAFDIETTTLKGLKKSFIYSWQFAYKSDVYIGRTYEDLYKFFRELVEICQRKSAILCIFVHNLSYEFHFIRSMFQLGPEDVFAVKSRKILRFVVEGALEFRCSYLHSGMSLKKYLQKMGCAVQKKELDYRVIRYPWTPLWEDEVEYIEADVLGLVEAIGIDMKMGGDDLYSFPLTSTGYVRREVKKAVRNIYGWRGIQANVELTQLLHEAFRGGNTHANRYYAEEILEDVTSWDRVSSYPDVMMNCEFPIKNFYKVEIDNVEALEKYIVRKHKAMIFRIELKNVRLKDPYWGCPYLSLSKVDATGYALDNGRILSADRLSTVLTEIDYEIVKSEYDYEVVKITEGWACYKGMLPEPIKNVIRGFYEKKTTLKGNPEEEYYYNKAKEMLNSLYGMSAEYPLKPRMLYVEGSEDLFIQEGPEDDAWDEFLEDTLNKRSRKMPLPFQIGVWVTAWARLRLEEGIRIAGRNFVYADTDSVKMLGSKNSEWNKFNHKAKNSSMKNGAYAMDSSGVTHYMGVYEKDGFYKKFCTLGAKKYVYEDDGGGLHVTIAGVQKHEGAKELQEMGGITTFANSAREGFDLLIFRDAGGMESVFNDLDNFDLTVYGKTIHIGPNIALLPSTYTVGVSKDYRVLLDFISKNSLTKQALNNIIDNEGR